MSIEQKPNLKAYCFITTEVYGQQPILDQLKEIPQVIESDRVAGTYDIATVIKTNTPEELGDVYLNKIQQIQGVLDAAIFVALE